MTARGAPAIRRHLRELHTKLMRLRADDTVKRALDDIGALLEGGVEDASLPGGLPRDDHQWIQASESLSRRLLTRFDAIRRAGQASPS